jgi:hypothetical protein
MLLRITGEEWAQRESISETLSASLNCRLPITVPTDFPGTQAVDRPVSPN